MLVRLVNDTYKFFFKQKLDWISFSVFPCSVWLTNSELSQMNTFVQIYLLNSYHASQFQLNMGEWKSVLSSLCMYVLQLCFNYFNLYQLKQVICQTVEAKTFFIDPYIG